MKPVPPLRLRDDPGAPALLRDDLARAARSPAVTFDTARGLAALEAAIGKASPPAPATPPATPLAGPIAKGVILAALVAGAAAVVGALRGGSTPAPAVAPSSPAASASVPDPLADAPSAASPDPAPAPSPASLSSSSPLPRPATAPPHASAKSSLQEEMEDLERLRALERSDPQQALALAEEGRRRFRGGVFGQEREVTAIAALVRLGRRSEAEARARAFVARNPRSPFVERVRTLAGLPPGE
jgi:hypothetical protein